MSAKLNILRACTVPQSLGFVTGVLPELMKKYDVTLLSSAGREWEHIRKQYPGVKCIEVNMERHISPFRDLKSLWRLWRVFRRERPQMVHSMTPKAGLLCMMAARFAGVPVRVHTFTGLVFPTAAGLKKRILMATDRLTCACATHVIPEGEGVKNDLLSNGITRKPIRVLGCGSSKGIDLARFDRTSSVLEQASLLRRSDLVTFLSVGRLVGDKGINELVEAFERVNEEVPDTRLVLVGAEEAGLDPLRPETLLRMETNGSIVSFGSQSDVRPWFAAADVHVLASYREGFPNVVLEAGAMGLPQIVTDINGANEIVVEGKNGTVVPSKSVDALYGAMMRMLDADYRRSLAANARSMVASRFEQGYVQRCLMEFYEEILGDITR